MIGQCGYIPNRPGDPWCSYPGPCPVKAHQYFPGHCRWAVEGEGEVVRIMRERNMGGGRKDALPKNGDAP